ncbi:hypothetical protein HKD37_17G047992 [Glycine soja]
MSKEIIENSTSNSRGRNDMKTLNDEGMKLGVTRGGVALEQSTPIRGSSSSTSSISFLSTFKEEVGNAAQKHKAKRVESVNDDVEAFGDHRESSDCSMHSKAEALEHMKKRDTGHQSVSLENITGDSTVLRIGDSAKVHKYRFNNNKREKPEKVRVVDDETGDKHEVYDCSYIELYKYWVSGFL